MMTADFHVLLDYSGEIVAGVELTFLVWIVSVVLGLLLGFILAIFRTGLPALVSVIIDLYVMIIRGTPFLVQLFLLYYGGPFVGLILPPLTAGILGLTIHASAYFAEIFRSGFYSVPAGQIEAAAMSGLTKSQTLLRVTLPQMMVVIFPSLINMVIILLKETAVLSVITVSELTATLSTIGSVTFAYIPTLGFLALFYWVSLEMLSAAGRAAEAWIGRHLAHQE
ncbi:amino acid ABC transporter permease [Ensifer aridi]|uniref:amino acid ABC transporter permease n=1 Tax=Ensifer aridi TaxID=1708715 RepID=UPI0004044188|nr:amino acid ABC transporter permease [Ensifer aridi]